MMKVGLISDTHGYIDERIRHHLAGCDEIWHAGDVGSINVIEQLESCASVKGVYGNIDAVGIRQIFPETMVVSYDSLTIMMIHIAGSLGKYNEKTRKLIQQHKPNVLICGHSHILKVKFDERFNLLYINPGAAGRHGFHKIRTLCTFEIENGKLEKFKVIELGPRSTQSID